MSELSPCPRCHRHVREAICPFCSAPTVRREPIATFGKMSRAMVFASATLTATGCGHAQRKPAADEMGEERHHGGGGCMDPDPQPIAELEHKKAEIEKERDGPQKDAELQQVDEELQRARQPQCMPYGAPPARRRIV